MTVLYVISSTKMDGSTISFIQMIKGMYKKNVKIYIIHPDRVIDPLFLEKTKKYVSEYIYVDLLFRIKTKDFRHLSNKDKLVYLIKKILFVEKIRDFIEYYNVKKVAKRIRPDIIHTNVGIIHSGFFVAKKMNIPHIWHIREYQTKDFHWNIMPSFSKFRMYLKESYVIAITKNLRDFFGINNKKTRVIYNGCFDSNELIEKIDFHKDNYFLCCSRVSPEKQQDKVIKAFSGLVIKHPDYKLKIAGFGEKWYIEKLKKLVKKYNVEDKVVFLGYVDDVRELMYHAKALIVASRCEAFGRMTIEAAGLGCYVVGNNTGGTKELINCFGGLLYNNSVTDLKNKMEQVIDLEQEKYIREIEKAKSIVLERFTVDKNTEQIFRFYNDILFKHLHS